MEPKGTFHVSRKRSNTALQIVHESSLSTEPPQPRSFSTTRTPTSSSNSSKTPLKNKPRETSGPRRRPRRDPAASTMAFDFTCLQTRHANSSDFELFGRRRRLLTTFPVLTSPAAVARASARRAPRRRACTAAKCDRRRATRRSRAGAGSSSRAGYPSRRRRIFGATTHSRNVSASSSRGRLRQPPRLSATMPPNALTGSASRAVLYASSSALATATPHGLVCFTTTAAGRRTRAPRRAPRRRRRGC